MIILLLFALQGTATVGDTIWVNRTVPLPAGWSARAPAWDPDGAVELLGTPVIDLVGDSVTVRYPLVVWQPGDHPLEVPGPVLLSPQGDVDSVYMSRMTITVSSVLPIVAEDSIIPPQPPAGIVPRPVVSMLPLFLLWGVTLVLVAPLHWWWRRRGKPTPIDYAAEATSAQPPVAEWAAAGELRAVIAAGAWELRQALAHLVPEARVTLDTEACLAVIGARKPAWPLDELGALLRGMDASRFAPMSERDALQIHERAMALKTRLAEVP
ncbi:MAG: hypothetical protein HKM89_05010 [Gemmatimonadales bacterium]|nr:hypothetical protein [Gemmatimonadales bacterium]